MAENNRNFGEKLASQFRNLEGRHPSQWPLAPRVLLGVGVVVLAVLLGYQFLWKGQMEELEFAQNQELKLREDYKSKMKQAVNLEALKEQVQQVKEYVATLEKQLPSKAEMDALLSDITQAGIGRGLQFESFKPGQPIVREYYAELPISIRITGNYHDVGKFVSDIANLPRIVTLNELHLVASSKDQGVLTLDTIAKTFRYLDSEEIEAQRTPQQPQKGGKK